MDGDTPISWLMFFTLAAGVVVAGGFFLGFLRSRHNRAIASSALGGEQRSRGIEPDGAGAELSGLLAVGLIAMALLVFGYRSHSGSAVAESNSAPNNQLATERTNPDAPKPYQPQNPAPDNRAGTTSSSSGAGANSGGHPEAAPKQ